MKQPIFHKTSCDEGDGSLLLVTPPNNGFKVLWLLCSRYSLAKARALFLK